MKKRKRDPEETLSLWTERDLTEAARSEELSRAFAMDEHLARISDVIRSGHHPVLSGESGVGKTAIIHELIRRTGEGHGLPMLQGKRILQISLHHRASGLKQQDQMRPEMHELVDALVECQDRVIPFFRDLHFALEFCLEAQLMSLAFRFRGPILAEGEKGRLQTMFEDSPELEQLYLLIALDEPSLEKTWGLLDQWARWQESRTGQRFEPQALSAALELSHRFLARDRLPRKAVDLLGQTRSLVPPDKAVGASDIIDLFCQNYSVPRMLVDPETTINLAETEELFRSKVLGQDEAVDAVVRLIGLIKAGLTDMRRPLAAFLFVGPTGVGKTHLAQLLAEYLFGSRERLIRFNMADYPAPDDATLLFGDPYGHNLPMRRGVLHQRLMGHPFAVSLLDEFEKANSAVHDRFLQLVDEGSFINGAGETVSCRSVIFIATSNTGAELYRGCSVGFTAPSNLEELDRELDKRLASRFRFEFLNRLDHVVHFHPLGRSEIRTIAMRELSNIEQRVGLRSRNLVLQVDEAVLDWLTAHGYDPQYGARFLRRTIERTVTTTLAETIVRQEPPNGAAICLSVRGRRILARVEGQEPKEQEEKKLVVHVPSGAGRKAVSLDRGRLFSEMEALLSRAQPLLTALDDKRKRRTEIMSRINAPDFWNEPEANREVLEGYRELDVAIQTESRFAGPLERMAELLEAEQKSAVPTPTHELARSFESAATALSRWEERASEEGPASLWLLIQGSDPLKPVPEWIEQLVMMELAWCRRLHLRSSVVAYGLNEGELARAALEVEGPGALSYLQMEEGIHRLHPKNGPALRAQIHVVPKKPYTQSDQSRIGSTRRRTGLFGLPLSVMTRLNRVEEGQTLELLSTDARTLSHLVSDLRQVLTEYRTSPTTTRIYAEGGTGARDPRTNAKAARLKAVLRGNLDPFLDAWRRKTIADQCSGQGSDPEPEPEPVPEPVSD